MLLIFKHILLKYAKRKVRESCRSSHLIHNVSVYTSNNILLALEYLLGVIVFLPGVNSKFNAFEECHNNASNSTCDVEGYQFSTGLLRRYAGRLLKTVCRPFREPGRCDDIVLDNITLQDANTYSALPALVKLAKPFG